MKKEEYLSRIDEVIARGPYTDTWDSLCEHPTPKWYARDKFGIFTTGVFTVFRLSETNGIPEICM